MSVRKLKAKQRGPFCSYCQQRATHRGGMFTRFASANHLEVLQSDDRKANTPDYSDAAFYAGYGP